MFARSQGHVEPVDDGTWLIGWGVGNWDGQHPSTAQPPDESITQVDPRTGDEILSLAARFEGTERILETRSYPVPAEVLADEFGPLAAALPASAHTAGSHRGAGDMVQAVVAFSRAVADFAADSPSLGVQGARVTAVEPLVLAGEAANAYLVTLSPVGDGTVTFGLIAERDCATGGICTADGAMLAEVPTALSIPRGSAPGRVTNVAVTAGSGELTVSWDAVAGATGYVVQWKLGAENWDPARQEDLSGGSATSHTIPNLVNGTAYTVRVIATKAGADDGVASEPVTGTSVGSASGVTLSLSPARVPEGAGATPVTVTATLNGAALAMETDVRVSVADGTAAAGEDFAAVPDFTLTPVADDGETLAVRLLQVHAHRGLAARRAFTGRARPPGEGNARLPGHHRWQRRLRGWFQGPARHQLHPGRPERFLQ